MISVERALWSPTEPGVSKCHLQSFINHLNQEFGMSLTSYTELHQYSVTNDRFWLHLSDFLKIRYSTKPATVLLPGQQLDTTVLYPPPQFFPGAKLNYAENCLESGASYQHAVIEMQEGAQNIRRYTFEELRNQVHHLSDCLKNAGIRRGDVVAGVLANTYFSLTLVLATAAIGAVYSSTATDMGAQGILDRLNQVNPKLLFFDNASLYNKRTHSLLEKAQNVLNLMNSKNLISLVVIPNIRNSGLELDDERSMSLDQFYSKHPVRSCSLLYEQVGFTRERGTLIVCML